VLCKLDHEILIVAKARKITFLDPKSTTGELATLYHAVLIAFMSSDQNFMLFFLTNGRIKKLSNFLDNVHHYSYALDF